MSPRTEGWRSIVCYLALAVLLVVTVPRALSLANTLQPATSPAWCAFVGWLVTPFGFCESQNRVSYVADDVASTAEVYTDFTALLPPQPSVAGATTSVVYETNYVSVSSPGVSQFELTRRLHHLIAYINVRDELTKFNAVSEDVYGKPGTRNGADVVTKQYLWDSLDRVGERISDLDGGGGGDTVNNITNNYSTTTNATGDIEADTLTLGTTTNLAQLTLTEAIYLSSFTPVTTTNRLYNNGGDLYWNGSVLSASSTGNWSQSSGNAYRLTGNVGIGTSTPESALTVVGEVMADSVIAELRDMGGHVCNVDAYGAVGDNATINDEAIAAAIADCGADGGTVLFPMGQYRISEPIVLDSPVTLMGTYAPRWSYASTPRSAIRADFGSFVGGSLIHVRDQSISGAGSPNNGGRLINLTIDGGSYGSDIHGVHFEGLVRDWKLVDVDISQTTGNGFLAEVGGGSGNPRGFTITGLSIYSADGHGFRATALNDSYIEDLLAVGNALRGIYLSSMGETKVNNSRAVFNALEGLYIDGASNNGGMMFTDFSTDRNDRHGVRISATGTTTVTFNGLLTRRDGANTGGGSETPYAGVAVIGTSTIKAAPVIINGLSQLIGVDDAGAPPLAPDVGVRVVNAEYVRVNGQLWGVSSAYVDGGGNSHFIIEDDSIVKTGSDWSNQTPPLYALKWVATSTGLYYASGTVSIGTQASSTRLLNITAATNAGARFTDTTNNVMFDMRAEDSQAFFGTFSSHDLRFQTNNTSRLTIMNTGNVGIGTTTPSHLFTVAGNMNLTGAFNANGSPGTAGMVLQTTGTGTQWVATSSLGITSGSSVTFGTDNQIPFTNSGGTNYDYSANLTFDGNNLGLGATNGIAFGGTRFITASTTTGSITFGERAGAALLSTGLDNVLIGYESGELLLDGQQNIGIGNLSLHTATTADRNIAIGQETLQALTTGGNNVAIGHRAGEALTTGGQNVTIGSFAMFSATSSDFNTAVGYSAFGDMLDGTYNSTFGHNSAESILTGTGNVFFGFAAGQGATTTSGSVIVGSQAAAGNGATNLTWLNNTIIGYRAGYTINGASNNVLLGYRAADNITTGSNNIVIGYDVNVASTTGSNQLNIGNILFGSDIDGTGNTLSSGNIGIGTTSPASKLDVWGNVNIGTSSTPALFVNSALSRVGINTASPSAPLQIDGGTDATLGGGGYFVIGSTSGANLAFDQNEIQARNNGSSATLNLQDGGGSVYIGGATDVNLNAGQASTGYTLFRAYRAAGNSSGIGLGYFANGSTDTAAMIRVVGANTDMVFANADSLERMRLTDGGRLGIGTSTPDYSLTVAGDISLTGALRASGNAGTAGMVLQTTGSGIEWVATSSLDISGGSLFTDGGSLTYLTSLTDSVAIGTSTQLSGARLSVAGDLAISRNSSYKIDDIDVITVLDSQYFDRSNMFVGASANSASTTIAYSNIFVGRGSLALTTGNSNTALGVSALGSIDEEGSNTAVGTYSLANFIDGFSNTALGSQSGNVLASGNSNVFIGEASGLKLSTSSGSVIIGTQSYGENYDGISASNIVTLGYRAGYNAETGANNNILIGYQAADNLTTGNNNIVIGYDIDSPTATADNVLTIGNLIFGTGVDGTGNTLSSGNIGIGTTSPSSKLTVAGTGSFSDIVTIGDGSQTGAHWLYVTGSTSDIVIGQSANTLFGFGAGTASYVIQDVNRSFPFVVGNMNAQPLVFGTTNTERMRIHASGNVNISTSTLDIADLVVGGNGIFTGNLGINTISSANKLDIGDGTQTGDNWLRLFGDVSEIYIGQSDINLLGLDAGDTGFIINNTGRDSDLAIGNLANRALIFGTNNTERLRIAADGEISTTNNLTLGGTLAFTDADLTSFTTPRNTPVPTKINVPYFDPGSFGQIVAFGVPSTTDSTARVLSLFDDRRVAHQPTLGVFSPDENNLVGFSWDGSDTTSYLKTTGGNVGIRSNTTDIATFLSSGNVGIGTTSPPALLTVGDDNLYMTVNNSVQENNDRFGLGFVSSGANTARRFTLATEEGSNRAALQFGDHSNASDTIFGIARSSDSGATWNQNFVVKGGGNIGLGTSTPNQKLTITQAADSTGFLIAGYDNEANEGGHMFVDSNGIFNIDVYGPTGAGYLSGGGSPTVAWTSSGFTVADDKELMFGDGLDVSMGLNTADSTFRIGLGNNISTTTGNILTINSSRNVGIGTTTPSAQLTTTGTVRFASLGSGGGSLITDADGNVTVSSDERLKDILGSYEAGLNEILLINPIRFNWNEESGFEMETEFAGFSAQNVQAALPLAVSENKTGVLTLADRSILAALVNAVKELYAMVTGNQEKIEELESRLEALEAQEGITPPTPTPTPDPEPEPAPTPDPVPEEVVEEPVPEEPTPEPKPETEPEPAPTPEPEPETETETEPTPDPDE